MLINLVRDQQPDQVIVAFDRPEPDLPPRGRSTPTRPTGPRPPTSCASRWAWSARWSTPWRLPVVEQAGFEADDVIATLATEGRDQGDEVVIVTGDRDSYQLVEDPLVKVLYNKRGVSDYALYDEAGILERTGVPPERYVEYAGAARRPVRQPARRARGGGEDGGQADHDLRRPRRDLRPRRGPDPQAARRTWPSTRQQVRQQRRADAAHPRRRARLHLGDLHRGTVDPDELRKLFDFLEFHSLAERLSEAFGERLAGDAARGRRCSRPRSPSWPTPAEAVEVLRAAGRRRRSPGPGRRLGGRRRRPHARWSASTFVRDAGPGRRRLPGRRPARRPGGARRAGAPGRRPAADRWPCTTPRR